MPLKFTILGCGSSMGVPRSDGYFGKCNPNNLKNYRTRCSAILQTKTDNILIDTVQHSGYIINYFLDIPSLLVSNLPRWI